MHGSYGTAPPVVYSPNPHTLAHRVQRLNYLLRVSSALAFIFSLSLIPLCAIAYHAGHVIGYAKAKTEAQEIFRSMLSDPRLPGAATRDIMQRILNGEAVPDTVDMGDGVIGHRNKRQP